MIMSNREILTNLRQTQFPDCVRLALDHLAYVSSHKSSSATSLHQVDVVSEQIVAEFIFFHRVKKVSGCRVCFELSVNMQFSGLNEIQSQLTAYIQAKLRVRLRFRVRVTLGLELGLGLWLTDRMHALARIGSKLTVYFV